MKKLSRRGLFGLRQRAQHRSFSLTRFYAERHQRADAPTAPPRLELRPELADRVAAAPPLQRKRRQE